MPAIYDLANRGLLPPGFSLTGFARRDWANEDFAQVVHDAVKEHARTEFREEVWRQLRRGLPVRARATSTTTSAFNTLRRTIEELDEVRGTGGNHAFYLAIPPGFFGDVVGQLKEHGLAQPAEGSWRRVVVEKPFGHDLESARELNATLAEVFPLRLDLPDRPLPRQGDRPEHPGDALRQRRCSSRSGTANYVDHVQITMAEDIGIGGRAGYYDGIGAARDVIQNHLMQLMSLVAMEEPTSFDAESLRVEKQKLLSAVTLPRRLDLTTARGQYAAGWQGGEKVLGFLEEEGVRKTSTHRDVRRDHPARGEPALGRGAVLPADRQAARPPGDRGGGGVQARTAPAVHASRHRGAHPQRAGDPDPARRGHDDPVRLEGAGHPMEIRDVNMDFAYGGSFTESSAEAYERLILDVLLGDPPLFPRHEEVELSWQILDPVLDHWAGQGQARPVRVRHLGAGVGRRDAGPRRPHLEAAVTSPHHTARCARTREDPEIGSS